MKCDLFSLFDVLSLWKREFQFRPCFFQQFRLEPDLWKIRVPAGTNRPEPRSSAPLKHNYHSKTCCRKDVTQYNISKTHCSIATIVVKSRGWFNFMQYLQQQKCCKTRWMQTMLYDAISNATWLASKTAWQVARQFAQSNNILKPQFLLMINFYQVLQCEGSFRKVFVYI